jgi:hypothetical protein
MLCAKMFGSKVGYEASAMISPLFGFMATTTPRFDGVPARYFSAANCMSRSIAVTMS